MIDMDGDRRARRRRLYEDFQARIEKIREIIKLRWQAEDEQDAKELIESPIEAELNSEVLEILDMLDGSVE